MRASAAIQEYLSYRKALGFVLRVDTCRLHTFLRKVGDSELDSIQLNQVQVFLEGKLKTISREWFTKFGVLSTFFKYCCSRGYMSRPPLPALLPKKPGHISPFLYSTEQVRSLLCVPDAAYRPTYRIEPNTIRCLLVLLYGTGLRPGEALRLARSDVDVDESLLLVRQTKFHKSRLVPFGSQVKQVLSDYDSRRPAGGQIASEAPFFKNQRQEPLTMDGIDDVFQWLRTEAGVLRTDGTRYQPRLYDFRHTFAVTRLVTWYRQGKDVQRLLPHLATYLGHVHIDSTAHYLTITNELMKEASSCFARYALGEAGHA